MKNNYIKMLSDTTFKYLMKNENTRGWFISLIKDITNIDISNYKFDNIELDSGNHNKNYKTDIRITKTNLNTIIIEINSNNYYAESVDVKNHSYLFKELGEYLKSGDNYVRKHAKLICFNNYRNPLDNDVKIINKVLTDRYDNRFIDDYVETFEIYLPVFKELWYNDSEEKKDYYHKLAMLSAENYNDFISLITTDEDKIILNELERLSMDDKFMNVYDAELNQKRLLNSAKLEGHEEGFDEGFEQGIEQGIEEKQTEIVENMIKNDFTIEQISLVTKLTIDEIKKIKEEM